MNLYDHLKNYEKQNILPMHMPGHKRNPAFAMDNPYAIDVTEVEGTDNLHHPEGVILALMEQMKKLGGISGILNMLPGAGGLPKDIEIDDNAFKPIEAIISLISAVEAVVALR